MNTFEKQFEDLDVQSGVMEDAMNKQAALSTPPDQVNTLLQQIADENGLEMKFNIPQAGTSAVTPAKAAVVEEDSLQARLNQLKGI